MRFAVEAWAPDYGPAADDLASAEPTADVEPAVEVPTDRWAPIRPDVAPPEAVVFVDGVSRIDAQVWFDGSDGTVRPGLCASYAAGAVHCDGVAAIGQIRVERGVFTSDGSVEAIRTRHAVYEPRLCAGDAEMLPIAVVERMRQLEAEVARGIGDAALIVLDGLLWGRTDIAGAIGYVKTHRAQYLTPDLAPIVASLVPGERTPLFVISSTWTRLSWYVRLPGGTGHPWAGVVRCEASPDLGPKERTALADLATAALPRFASAAHKDPRAPQNLYPIAGLERQLRRRSGDSALIYRSLRQAARAAG